TVEVNDRYVYIIDVDRRLRVRLVAALIYQRQCNVGIRIYGLRNNLGVLAVERSLEVIIAIRDSHNSSTIRSSRCKAAVIASVDNSCALDRIAILIYDSYGNIVLFL